MPLPVLRAAIFDLDGTLADTVPDLHRLLGELLAERRLDAPSPAAVRRMVGDGVRALIARAMEALGSPVHDEALDRLYERFLSLYVAAPCRLTTLYPNVEAALGRLVESGFALGVCTNKPQAVSELILESLGVIGLFGAVVGGDVLPARKPDPAHLGHVLAQLSVDRRHAVMVGDSRNDLLAACGLGVGCVLVNFGYSETPVAALGADAVVDDFGQLADVIEWLCPAPRHSAEQHHVPF